jgi:hypothetical protein
VDTAIDPELEKIGNSALQGKIAVANAKLAYDEFRRIFKGKRWKKLSGAGARVQRCLWASTSTKNPAYPDTLYVDELMQTFAHKPPLHLTHEEPYHSKHLRAKLATYYRNRRKQLEDQYPDFFDPDLHTLFSRDPEHAGRELAYRYMNKHRRFIVKKVASWTGARKYTVNDLLNSLVERCKETQLRLKKDEHETALDLCIYLTHMVSNYHYTGKYTRKR